MGRKPRRDPETPQEAAVQDAKTREAFARQKELADLKAILADARVRDFLWRLMAKAGMFRTHFNSNAAIMGHNTGLADMGTAIYQEIVEAAPQAWIDMQVDALNRQRESEMIAELEDGQRQQQGED